MPTGKRTFTIDVVIALVMMLVAIGGIVFAAGGLATKTYVDETFVRKETIQPQIDHMQKAIDEMGGDIKTLIKSSGAGKP